MKFLTILFTSGCLKNTHPVISVDYEPIVHVFIIGFIDQASH